MNNAQILAGIASSEKEMKKRRKFLVSFIKEQLDKFNSLSSKYIDTIPMDLLESTSKSLSLLMLSANKIHYDNSQERIGKK